MQTYARGDLVFDLTDAGPPDGDLIVLLHGFPQNRHSWDKVIPALTGAGYRVLAPDQRGYSPAARPLGRRAYVTKELVDDVLALLDAAGAERAHLVGHDWGAQVAWSIASSAPERLRSLTAVSVPHPVAFLSAMRRGQALKSWYMLAFQAPFVPEALLPGRFGARFLGGSGLSPEQIRFYLDPLGRDGLTAAINWYRALPFSRKDSGAYGHRVTVPTLYVWSDGDVALTRAGAEATVNYVTGPYRFEELAGVSHWIPEEKPDVLAGMIVEHLAAHP
ncbi:alpha/beta fold hydrolase [uncultured Jatrophihabitans sp.]|uniref:alpha/beta fold hydrolase n=1 Tax=uncultured Jatrophihabitans sp. TaxID=1610747 RepID=UPI0035CBFD5D